MLRAGKAALQHHACAAVRHVGDKPASRALGLSLRGGELASFEDPPQHHLHLICGKRGAQAASDASVSNMPLAQLASTTRRARGHQVHEASGQLSPQIGHVGGPRRVGEGIWGSQGDDAET